MASTVLKATTGLTGLAVSSNPHHSLRILYGKILRALDRYPETSVYKQETKKLVEHRLTLVTSEPNVAKLEQKLNAGQIEEVIKQAENEAILAKKLLDFKIWEPLVANAPPSQWKWPL